MDCGSAASAGRADALGRKITLNDSPYEVIGVMPREFYFLPARDIDIWMPTSFSARDADALLVARRALRRAAQAWRDASAGSGIDGGFESACVSATCPTSARGGGDALAGGIGGQNANVVDCAAGRGGGGLADLVRQSGEFADVALGGASPRSGGARGARRRTREIDQQFLVESLALAGFGALAGLALAIPVMRFLETLVPETMAAIRLTLDWRLLAFSAGIAVAAGLTFGLAPALGWSRVALQEGLRDGGRGSSGPRSHWFQHSLIVIETALAVALLAGGGLLLQSFQHLRRLDLGIRGDNLLTFETPLFRYSDFERRVAFVNAELEKIRAIPGVISAGAISNIPLTQIAQTTRYAFPGQPASETRSQDALSRVVTRDYFATVGARLREGRFFDVSDQRSESPAAIVNESFADRNFPGRSPLGARFKFGHLGEKGYSYTIVGVVKEIRERGVAEELKPAIYRVHEQADQTGNQPSGIVVRASVEPTSIVPAVRQAIWSVDKNQPITRVQTFEDIVARQLSAPSQNTALLSAFALLALLLASLGLYGVLSYAVTQRANEIGVRMALGATSNDILLSFGGRGLKLTILGIAVGSVLAAVAARFMTTLLYGFRPDYLPTIAMASLILLSVAALACFVPARRAANVDPLVVLRNE